MSPIELKDLLESSEESKWQAISNQVARLVMGWVSSPDGHWLRKDGQVTGYRVAKAKTQEPGEFRPDLDWTDASKILARCSYTMLFHAETDIPESDEDPAKLLIRAGQWDCRLLDQMGSPYFSGRDLHAVEQSGPRAITVAALRALVAGGEALRFLKDHER